MDLGIDNRNMSYLLDKQTQYEQDNSDKNTINQLKKELKIEKSKNEMLLSAIKRYTDFKDFRFVTDYKDEVIRGSLIKIESGREIVFHLSMPVVFSNM